MHTLAQPYFMPSSQMALISSQVAVWASRGVVAAVQDLLDIHGDLSFLSRPV